MLSCICDQEHQVLLLLYQYSFSAKWFYHPRCSKSKSRCPKRIRSLREAQSCLWQYSRLSMSCAVKCKLNAIKSRHQYHHVRLGCIWTALVFPKLLHPTLQVDCAFANNKSVLNVVIRVCVLRGGRAVCELI